MKYFNNLYKKIEHWFASPSGKLRINGINSKQWAFFFQNFFCEDGRNHFIICPNPDVAENFFETLKDQIPQENLLYFPGHEASLYQNILPSEKNLLDRFKVLDLLSRGERSYVVISTIESFFLKIPPKSFFKDNLLKIAISDVFSPMDLAKTLSGMGYSSTVTVEEPGTFSKKGEIFDIYPISSAPIRIAYFDEMVEKINLIDLESQKTLWDRPLEHVEFAPGPSLLTKEIFREKLRENIPQAPPSSRERFEKRKEIFSKLSNNLLFEDYASFVPLFFSSPETLFDFIPLKNSTITLLEGISSSQSFLELMEELRVDFEKQEKNQSSDNLLPSPEKLYEISGWEKLEKVSHLEINPVEILAQGDSMTERIDVALEDFLIKIKPSHDKFEFFKNILNTVKNFFDHSGQVIFSTHLESSRKEIDYLLEGLDLSPEFKSRISFIKSNLQKGFYYNLEKTLVLTDGDLFGVKIAKVRAPSNQKTDLFAEQLSTLKKGDFVIHSNHGMGVYEGLEMVGTADFKTDCLVIRYDEGDKVYVPVYKINLVQKHADSSLDLKPNNLRTQKFDLLKERAKKSVKKLAFDLLELQAKRNSSKAYSFSAPDHHFKEFELAFPFEETPDQGKAIEDVLESLQRTIPMDHLVCGDVGFGKTEVAMRAAYKCVLEKKQVAVLVPTTILALQHYNSFKQRFSDFAVNIEFLSRFKTPKQEKEIKEKVENGKIDILIGTHKILSGSLKFLDLGLVIVDEEQRFGVGHKEKLKLLKTEVHFLTLTATPIPRTMQLAFLGLKDLSLIQTAPPKRQSIKTYIIRESDETLSEAMEKELSRGGQVFIVHNRVADIELVAEKFQKLAPKAKIIIAHGQMAERELEKRMAAFYNGDYQVLISTTIIESGLDIPNANTMIIFNAQNFGLSQLHQLRGRIGRSERKAYAYFVVPKDKIFNEVAEKRLEALTKYADKGSGFAIASSDLQIRGAGDILGGEQSGHIESVGLELYMKLLKDAIYDLKGEKVSSREDIEIATPFEAFIPKTYIEDSAERLRQYKKMSNCDSHDRLTSMQNDLGEIYGPLPKELINLFKIIEARIYLSHLGLQSVKVLGGTITMQFDKAFLDSSLELRDKIVETFLSLGKSYQFSPQFKVTYSQKNPISQETFLKFSRDIAQKIAPC
jgi:transcription-repair coupling factor (superfamily II helicase)